MRIDPIMILVLVIASAAVIVTVSLVLRYKRRELFHREQIAAIEKGLALPASGFDVSPNGWTPRTMLLRGLMWLFSGISLLVFLFVMAISVHREIPAWIRVDEANRAKVNGATEAQVAQIMNDKPAAGMPAGVALIGLIPMGVGLAYPITYRAEQSSAQAAGRGAI